MNLSIHLALTLNYLWEFPISFFYVMNLSSLLYSYSKKKYRNFLLIEDQNIRKTLLTKQIIVSKVVFFLIQGILITLYIGHRFRIV